VRGLNKAGTWATPGARRGGSGGACSNSRALPGPLLPRTSLAYLGDDAVLVGIGDLDNILLHAAEERIAVVLRVVLLKDVLEGLGMGESSMLGLVRAGVRCATRIAQQ